MQHQPVRALLLARRCTVALALLGACGDNACPGPERDGACTLARFVGHPNHGELGFRFGEPVDIDRDGELDYAAGARHADGLGEVTVWNLDGELAHWRGDTLDGLFGHVVLAAPGRVYVSAPNAIVDGEARGYVDAYAITGERLWRRVGELHDGFGWHLAFAGDRDGDGLEELWVGAPSNAARAHVYMISGADGRTLVTIESTRSADEFGWYIVPTDDLDGDGNADVAIGAIASVIGGAQRGTVTLASADGHTIRELAGELPGALFGQMLAPLPDLDGDHVGELAIAAPSLVDSAASEVSIVSPATGERLHMLTGREPGENYGRMLATVDDLDGDGVRDLAIGAPWADGGNGRIELRSLRTLAVLADLHGTETGWFGWHITRAPRGLVVSSTQAIDTAGVLDVLELRR